MEVIELKGMIEQRFDALDKRLDKLDVKVTTHDHWLWAMRGVVSILLVISGWIGIKLRF